MSEPHPKGDTISLDEATISNRWEITALVEVLEPKGLCTRQDLYNLITEYRAQKAFKGAIPTAAG